MPGQDSIRSRWGPGLKAAVPLLLLGLALVLLSALVLDRLRERHRATAQAEARAILADASIAVESWFDRFRPLPSVYAGDPRIRAALQAPGGDPSARLGPLLADWTALTGASDSYLLDASGVTLAASNWDQEVSFVGQSYAYRPYFTDALAGDLGQFFALGTRSGRRGYYLSAPVQGAAGILGVMVVKVGVEALEASLAEMAAPIFVTDEAGIIVLATEPDLRLRASRPLSPDRRARITADRQYDLAQLTRAPLEQAGGWGPEAPLVRVAQGAAQIPAGTYLQQSAALPRKGWEIHVLLDTVTVRNRTLNGAATLFALLLAALALGLLGVQQRRQLVQRLADRERARAHLERRVAQRTGELTTANRRLEAEVSERRATEGRLRATQAELVQAGKLAALGQMSAALSHEFNQPLTAIRTYSENASAFFEAGRGAQAKDNLARVLRLTEKMAQLSKHLTGFARQSGQDMRPVALAPIIDEALALLAARIEQSGAQLRRNGPGDLRVWGGETRLQHVVMNLLGNALDAVPPGRRPEIEIACATGPDETVILTVSDNGTGVPEAVLGQIFDPFFTTKEVGQGLGLGLSICFNILRDFGGMMAVENLPGQGARFTVTLRQARDGPPEAL